MTNTWPNNYRHALTQDAHEKWNSQNYPGTRQLCTYCEQPTGRCEEDQIFVENLYGTSFLGPLCEECYDIIDSPNKRINK